MLRLAKGLDLVAEAAAVEEAAARVPPLAAGARRVVALLAGADETVAEVRRELDELLDRAHREMQTMRAGNPLPVAAPSPAAVLDRAAKKYASRALTFRHELLREASALERDVAALPARYRREGVDLAARVGRLVARLDGGRGRPLGAAWPALEESER